LGFGSSGRYRDLPAYDDVIQATTGAATLLSRVDGNNRPRYLPSLIADKVAGLHGAYAALAAVVHKLRTGEGQKVEVPLFESFAHFLLQEHLFGGVFNPQPYPMGYPRQLDPSRQPFPTADGYISIVLYTDKIAADIIDLIGDKELKEDCRFKDREGRFLNARHLHDEMTRLLPRRTTAEWTDLFEATGIPSMPMSDLSQVLDDGHLNDVGFFQPYDHPTEGSCVSMRAPVKFSVRESDPLGAAPRLGEHTTQLRDLVRRRPAL
jgi:crotonobetainyl-CoA:carnitine CoA-transferase CaiB-like acyl-CoA transferase